jgi:transposase-like protein
MPHGPIEILAARERRLRWSVEQKLRIVAETEEPGPGASSTAGLDEIRETRS